MYLKWKIAPLAFLLLTLVLGLTSCSNQTKKSSDPVTEKVQATQSPINPGVSTEDVCNGVGSTYQTYQKEFSDFRYGPSSTPWQVFYDLSDKASDALQEIASQIDEYGIDWDSPGIVSSLIYSSADTINLIKEYTSKNYFPPGSDLQTLLNQIDVNLISVLNSSCTGHD